MFTENTNELFRTSFDLTLGRVSTKVMDDARRLLELIMLRRMKTSPSVNLNLPPKEEVLLFVPLTPMQRFWYTRLLTRTDKGLLEELFQGAKEKELKALEEEKEEEKSLVSESKMLDVESGSVGPADADGWAESREILKKAIEQESHDTSRSTAWRKLMNLLMQLRKVCATHSKLLDISEMILSAVIILTCSQTRSQILTLLEIISSALPGSLSLSKSSSRRLLSNKERRFSSSQASLRCLICARIFSP